MHKPMIRAHACFLWIALGLSVATSSLVGCKKSESTPEPSAQAGGSAGQAPAEQNQGTVEQPSKPMEGAAEPKAQVTRAVAMLNPTQGNEVHGTVRFEQTPNGVKVSAEVSGLAPDSTHGFHIHEKGDCSAPDASSAGGHYAPRGNPHGLPPDPKRHAGDMGNIKANAEGKATMEAVFDNFSLTGESPVLGRAVIVHEKEDLGTQPAGDAGSRVACGVIEAEK